MVVGSDLRADLRVAHPLIARAHVLLRFEQGRWRAVDNNTLNGVYVDGRRVPAVDIQDGQTINIGKPDGPRITFEIGQHTGAVGLLPPPPRQPKPPGQPPTRSFRRRDTQRSAVPPDAATRAVPQPGRRRAPRPAGPAAAGSSRPPGSASRAPTPIAGRRPGAPPGSGAPSTTTSSSTMCWPPVITPS
ncbi:FHA domain protein [Mycobacterium avium subsp. avium 2285 (R)]|nr:FHA domain protein [Mycobacterium avium subsp. avium 2285 (R)]